MRTIMLVTNAILSAVSCAGIIVNLVMTHFGYAWLCVIPMVYGIFNMIAIDE